MTKKQPSFETMYEELERIVAKFEQEEINIEESLQEFRRGMELAKQLKQRLEKLENEIEEITTAK